MKVVVQRVQYAEVRVEGEVTGRIEKGLLVFAGFHKGDQESVIQWMSDKILKLRIFEDEEGKMNRSVLDTEGSLLIVSQFTLYGSVKKGTRPSFVEAAPPDIAKPMYDSMVKYLRERTNLQVEHGVFGAMMEVDLLNDGPVTILIEKE